MRYGKLCANVGTYMFTCLQARERNLLSCPGKMQKENRNENIRSKVKSKKKSDIYILYSILYVILGSPNFMQTCIFVSNNLLLFH